MKLSLINLRKNHEFRTDTEEKETKKIGKLLKRAFPCSNIKTYWGSKIEIYDNDIQSFLVVVDDFVFRSSPKNLLPDVLNDIYQFFCKHRIDTKTQQWYLYDHAKNKKLYLKFDSFNLDKEKSFHKAFPAFEPKQSYEIFYNISHQEKSCDKNLSNCIFYKNIVPIKKFKSALSSRIKYNKWMSKMILVFCGNVFLCDYYLNYKEGVGHHLLEKMIGISKAY
jgi:hypothetical protein